MCSLDRVSLNSINVSDGYGFLHGLNRLDPNNYSVLRPLSLAKPVNPCQRLEKSGLLSPPATFNPDQKPLIFPQKSLVFPYTNMYRCEI